MKLGPIGMIDPPLLSESSGVGNGALLGSSGGIFCR